MKYLLFIMISVLSFSKLTFSQDNDSISIYKFWISGGIWVDRDLTYSLSYSFSSGNNFYKIGYMKKGESFPYVGAIGEEGIRFNSVDLSIGRRLQWKWLQTAFCIGPAFVYGDKRISRDEQENFAAFGAELETQVLFRPADEVGVGIGFYGNINFEKPFAGVNFTISLGNGK